MTTKNKSQGPRYPNYLGPRPSQSPTHTTMNSTAWYIIGAAGLTIWAGTTGQHVLAITAGTITTLATGIALYARRKNAQ